jgi:hypothetical protein
MRKNIQVKKYSYMVGGELPDTKACAGMFKKSEVQQLRANPRLRSPFGFCGSKRTV